MLLRAQDLCVQFWSADGPAPVVAGLSLEIDRGQVVALVGESGCGKTVTALAILHLLPRSVECVVTGQVRFHGRDLLALSEREMRRIRGNQVAMVFQEPMTSLNPVLTVGEQIAETLRLHRRLSRRAARARTVELLYQVGISAAEQRRRQYPHELSGGMRQRVMIAMAVACEPALLIADEPTTALDVTLQAQILRLLRDLQQRTGMALLLITHDLGVVAQVCDAVCVMYAGRIVERGPVARLLTEPRHPYTRGLLRCTPRLDGGALADTPRRERRLAVIPGEVPDPRRRPSGCPFHPRCELGRDDPLCRTSEPPMRECEPGRVCACWKAEVDVSSDSMRDRAG